MTQDREVGGSSTNSERVRPTLVLAVGGTGARAVKSAKAKILELSPKGNHFVAYCAIDTDRKGKHLPNLLENTEFIHIGDFDSQKVIMSQYTENTVGAKYEWFPPALSSQQVFHGAGSVRPIGRLAYAENRLKIKEHVSSNLQEILNPTKMENLREIGGPSVDTEGGIDVHIVCSVCGGTGASMFLDIAHDVKAWIRNIGHTPRVMGHLVLPKAFQNVPAVQNAVKANAYVALQELDWFMNDQVTERSTLKQTRGANPSAPFDICFLLNGNDIDIVTAKIGEFISLTTTTEIGEQFHSAMSNLGTQRLSVKDPLNRSCCYSTYGVYASQVPAEYIAGKVLPGFLDEVVSTLRNTVGDRQIKIEDTVSIESVDQIKKDLKLRKLDFNHARVHECRNEPSLRELTGLDPDHVLTRDVFEDAIGATDRYIQKSVERQTYDRTWKEDSFVAYVNNSVADILLSDKASDSLSEALRQLTVISQCLKEFAAEAAAVADAVESEQRQARERIDQIRTRRRLRGQDAVELFEELMNLCSIVEKATQAISYTEMINDVYGRFESNYFKKYRDLDDALKDTLSFQIDTAEHGLAFEGRNLPCEEQAIVNIVRIGQAQHIRSVRKRIAEELPKWESDNRRKLQGWFVALCTRVLKEFILEDPSMSCDQLMLNARSSPCEDDTFCEGGLRDRLEWIYDKSATPFARTERVAGSDAEPHETSYIGRTSSSPFYTALHPTHKELMPSSHAIQEMIPIVRTVHGFSLIMLPELDNYGEAFFDSIVNEQRWDFHFTSDKHWLREIEFVGKSTDRTISIASFSLAEDILFAKDNTNGEYYWISGGTGENADDGPKTHGKEPVIGKTRYDAFIELDSNKDLWEAVSTHFQHISDAKEIVDRARNKIDQLRDKSDQAFQTLLEKPSLSGQLALKRDLYLVHSEIRALLPLTHTTDLSL